MTMKWFVLDTHGLYSIRDPITLTKKDNKKREKLNDPLYAFWKDLKWHSVSISNLIFKNSLKEEYMIKIYPFPFASLYHV